MPKAGYTFKEWASNIIGMTFADNTSATTTFVMPNENVTVTACFKQESAATLSESDGLTSAVFAATNGKYATFGRTFTSGVASTVCLPFNYASSQASGKFYVFAGIDKTKDPWEVTMVNANKVSGMLTAGTPYLFMPSADQTATFGGTVKASTAGYTDQTDGDGGTWRFIGNYEEKRWDATHNTEEIGSIYGFASGQGYEGTAASTAAGEFLRLRTECENAAIPTPQRLFPGAREMLLALRERAVLAIASNGRPEYVAESLALTGLESVFTDVQGRCPGKVKADLVRMLLDRLPHAGACLVGDALGDIAAAHACGIPALAVRYGYGAPDDWLAADAAVETLPEVAVAALRLEIGRANV